MPTDAFRSFNRFVAELRRRRVVRVGTAYVVGGWIVIEAAAVLVPGLLLPSWITRAVILMVLLGFPVAVVLAWAFDITPDGIRRTPDPEEGSAPARPEPAAPVRPRGGSLVTRVALAGAVVVVGGGAAYYASDRARDAEQTEALALLPEIRRLAEERRFAEAYELALRAEAVLPSDSALANLWPVISDLLTVRTEPAGARVTARPFAGGAESPASYPLGTTPIEGLRIPRTAHHLAIELPGFAPAERLASSALVRGHSYEQERDILVELELVPDSEMPEGAVYVAGGDYELVSPDMPARLTAWLDGYWIDRFEVTNAQFQEFVTGGGYRTPGLWPSPVVVNGDTVAFDRIAEHFTDRTGLPAPRGWSSRTPPPGLEDHPVTGVSWYEAAAYCAFRGMSLPSVFQWEKAARDGIFSWIGVVMPWGFQSSGERFEGRANFAGSGTVPVDAHPFGISPWGAYAMAGNVKEWVGNPAGAGRVVTGGSWEDPAYVFSEFGTLDPAATSPSLGFRCARVRASDARRSRDQGAHALEIDRLTPTYQPVDEARFQTLLSHYRYDPRPLEAEVLERAETPEWTRERIRYAGPDGAPVLAYLWLPKSTPAPHQTVVYVPGSDTFFGTSVPDHVEGWIAGLIRSGRAVFAVVLEGMAERPWPVGYSPPEPSTVRFRDLVVRHATELRLGIDYLATRRDVDLERLAYAGMSFGAGSRLPFAAVEDRFRAVVLIGGGIDERMKPTLPEADNVNFAPYIRQPKLLINGKQDEEHPWLSRGLPLWNLLTEPKELILVDDAGHVPPPETLIPAINSFLDRTLAPVPR